MISIWEKPVSHGEILKRVWKELEAACSQRKHAFHLATFGTLDGKVPSVRTVTLRRFLREERSLVFHAHTGSPKVDQVKRNPIVTWLFYNPIEKFQVRVVGRATVHTRGNLVDEQWSRTNLFSRRCYIGIAPGTVSKKPHHGMPDEIVNRDPTEDECVAGRVNFSAVTTKIDIMDCVELDVRGHRRSHFRWDEEGQLETTWLTP